MPDITFHGADRPNETHYQIVCDNREGFFVNKDDLASAAAELAERHSMLLIERVDVIGLRLIFNDITDTTLDLVAEKYVADRYGEVDVAVANVFKCDALLDKISEQNELYREYAE